MKITYQRDEEYNELIMTAVASKSAPLTVQDLHKYLGHLLLNCPNMADKPVALCLPEVDTSLTLIVKAENEGDNSTLWLCLNPEITNEIALGDVI